jgi:hypothetical protein
MEDKAAAPAQNSAPEPEETKAQLSEDELNTVAGGISVHPEGFVRNSFEGHIP